MLRIEESKIPLPREFSLYSSVSPSGGNFKSSLTSLLEEVYNTPLNWLRWFYHEILCCGFLQKNHPTSKPSRIDVKPPIKPLPQKQTIDEKLANVDLSQEEMNCSICFEPLSTMVTLNCCKKSVDLHCLQEWYEEKKPNTCFLCQKDFNFSKTITGSKQENPVPLKVVFKENSYSISCDLSTPIWVVKFLAQRTLFSDLEAKNEVRKKYILRDSAGKPIPDYDQANEQFPHPTLNDRKFKINEESLLSLDIKNKISCDSCYLSEKKGEGCNHSFN